MNLRPYQKEALSSIFKEWSGEHRNTLLVLPTGCGKTIVFSKVAEQCVKNEERVLILAHREELLDQAADKLRNATGIESAYEKAEKTALGATEMVTVGSVQTLCREARLQRFPQNYYNTIIIDEAHHAVSDSYRKILDYFSNAKLLGVTATPDRGDMRGMSEVFNCIAYEYSLRKAIQDGYLVRIMAQTIPLQIDLSEVHVKQGDYDAGELGSALEPYLPKIVFEMRNYCMGRKTVVFLPLIATSQKFCNLLNENGFRACEVNGGSKDREEVLSDFESGKYNVICNSMLLTEGWDCPSVDCIIVLRPTKVRALYSQMIGRGTRLHEGKKNLLILDFLWHTARHELCRPASLIGKEQKNVDQTMKLVDESVDAWDIMEAEETAEKNAKEEREAALAAMIAENAKKKRKCVDILQIEYTLDFEPEEPVFKWQKEDATDKQKETLLKNGIDADGMSKGVASQWLDRIFKRHDAHLATIKQLNQLQKRGFQNVADWTFDEASKMISRIADNHWKVPYEVDPATYRPVREAENPDELMITGTEMEDDLEWW